jgi:uncharacterized protein (TIGR02117 family)
MAVLAGGYIAAGLVGGAVPTNAGWIQPARGVTIAVETNGIHTGIVVPKVATGVDWRGLFPGRDLADPRQAGWDHLAIGWGEQAFFLQTQTWSDVRLRTVLAAAIGSDATLLHVEHVAMPRPSASERRVVLRPEEYRRLAAVIRATLVPGGRHYRGYGDGDVFYQARGRYDAVHTCNAWTGGALRRAGVRVGAWTPFPVSVMGWF